MEVDLGRVGGGSWVLYKHIWKSQRTNKREREIDKGQKTETGIVG